MKKGLKVLSLFDGISCGRLALDDAGINVSIYVAYETKDSAKKISYMHFPEIIQMGDVFKADFTMYEGFDLLLGGSPCNNWSISNKNRELNTNGKGWSYFLRYLDALKESKCPYFLFENSAHIAPKIIDAISIELNNATSTGLNNVSMFKVNSGLFSAQSRLRLYWTNIPVKFDNIPSCSSTVADILSSNSDNHPLKNVFSLCTLNNSLLSNNTICSNNTIRIGQLGKGGQGNRVYSINGKSTTVTANTGGHGHGTNLYLVEAGYIRALTADEAEALQTLPLGYTNVQSISSTQRLEAIGNGWTVKVISHILKALPQNYLETKL